jgi:hypothetical protein
MKSILVALLAVVPLAALAQGGTPSAAQPITLSETIKGKIDATSIEGLLLKAADGQVSAAALAGVKADVVEEVHNLRDYNVMLKALDKNASGIGFAVTPARTRNPFPSVSLQEYRESGWVRFAASTSFSYAQGTSPIGGKEFTKQAVSISSSGFFHADHDPVVHLAKTTECAKAAQDVLVEKGFDKPTLSEGTILEDLVAAAAQGDADARNAIAAIRQRAASGAEGTAEEREAKRKARRQAELLDGLEARQQIAAGNAKAADAALAKALRASPEVEQAALKAFNDCAKRVLDELGKQWNRSRYSVSFGTGTVKAKDGTGSGEGLGRTLAASVLYGFEHVDALRNRAAITVTVRRSQGEPIASTLGSANVRTKDRTLTGVRLSGGSSGFRALIEANNRKDEEVGATESTLRRALGLDVRVMDGAWLSLRYGKQRKLDGKGDENASFLVLNLSPTALLDFKR